MRLVDVTQTTPERTPVPGLRRGLFWASAMLVIVLDQASKELIRALTDRGDIWPSADWPVRLHHLTNSGAAFGILKDQTGFLVITTIIGLAAIYFYYRYPPYDHSIVPFAVGLILGGAIGNLLDRVRLGEVTDFIDFSYWPAFNIADSAITIGIAILILGYLITSGRTGPASDADH